MSAIPYDLLPCCDPDFIHMKLERKQSFVSRFFGPLTSRKDNDVKRTHSTNSIRPLSSTSSSGSYAPLNRKVSTSSIRIPMTSPRPRSNTASSSTSISSFVFQNSTRNNFSYRRIPSRSPGRERHAFLDEDGDDDWTPVERYY